MPKTRRSYQRKKTRRSCYIKKLLGKESAFGTMTKSCAVATCKNYGKVTKGKGIIYHNFPKNDINKREWVAACRRKDSFNATTSSICSVHFCETDYDGDLQNRLLGLPLRKKLKDSAIPSRFLGPNDQTSTDQSNMKRMQKDQRKEIIDLLLNTMQSEMAKNIRNGTLAKTNECLPSDLHTSGQIKVPTSNFDEQYLSMRKKYDKLRHDHFIIKKRMKKQVSSLSVQLAYYKKRFEKLKMISKNPRKMLKTF